jgi:hypothetical protein
MRMRMRMWMRMRMQMQWSCRIYIENKKVDYTAYNCPKGGCRIKESIW